MPHDKPIGDPIYDLMTNEEVSKEFVEIMAYEEDWDSYGGFPTTPEAIGAALFLLSRVGNPWWIAPLPGGGVFLNWPPCPPYPIEISVDVEADGKSFGYLQVKGDEGYRQYQEDDDVSVEFIAALLKEAYPS